MTSMLTSLNGKRRSKRRTGSVMQLAVIQMIQMMTKEVEVAPMPVPVHAMPLLVPTEVLHAMPGQGRLVTDLPKYDTPYDLWGRISEAQ
jgi:hypothetical protein